MKSREENSQLVVSKHLLPHSLNSPSLDSTQLTRQTSRPIRHVRVMKLLFRARFCVLNGPLCSLYQPPRRRETFSHLVRRSRSSSSKLTLSWILVETVPCNEIGN